MGNVRVLFDYKVRLDDIAKAMSILAGNKPFDQEAEKEAQEKNNES